LSDRRLQKRYARRFAPRAGHLERLSSAIHTLIQAGGVGDPFFLSHSLELLVKHLGASQTTLVMVSQGMVDTRWWWPEGTDDAAPAPVGPLCDWLLEHPDRLLVVKDFRTDPHTRKKAELTSLPHQAALGCALRQGDGVRALLFAFFDQPQVFPRTAFTLLEAVAGFISRMLEIEDLKQSLNRLEDALAITQAVMEDSSTRDPDTDLPNLRYLEIWEKAMLASDHRPESLVVAECHVAMKSRKDAAKVRQAAEGIRAGDLVVRLAPGRFMIIFQHTPRSIAHVLLLRMRSQLDGAPMGATLWVPGTEGLGLESCRASLDAALAASRAMANPGLVWVLPPGLGEDSSTPRRPAAPVVAPPQVWQPPTLRRA
jgi:hypothetical protein